MNWAEGTDLSSRKLRCEFIAQHPDLITQGVVSRITALVPQLLKSNPRKALELAELSLLFAEQLQDSHCRALGLRAMANALYGAGRNQAAVEHHRKAIRVFHSLGEPEQVARTLSSSIQPLILQGDHRSALAAARRARKIFTQLGNGWRLARLDLNVGNILDRQDRFAEALRRYESAYAYFSANPEEDPEAVAVALHNMAVSYVSLNDFRRAESTYEKARTFALSHNMAVLVGQADYNIAWLHYLRGDYGQAIAMLRTARESCRASGDDYHVALSQLDLSEIYLDLNLSREAAETAEQAAEGFQRLGMQYEWGKGIGNLGLAFGQMGRRERALALLGEARRAFVAEKNKVLPSVVDLYRAILLFRENNNDLEARRLATGALRVFKRAGVVGRVVNCRLLLARADTHAGDVCAAQRQCAEAIRQMGNLDLPSLWSQVYEVAGDVHAAAGNDPRSYQAYQRARQCLEGLRSTIFAEELKISFMKNRIAVYEALVGLQMKRARDPEVAAEIFGYIQQAKSRTLLDSIAAANTMSSLPMNNGGSTARKAAQLREELNWYFHKIRDEHVNGSRSDLSELRAECRRREWELLRLLREETQEDGNGSCGQLATAMTADQLAMLLPDDATLVEYFQTEGKLILALLNRDGLHLRPLGDASAVSSALEHLLFQLSKLRLDRQYQKLFETVLNETAKRHLLTLYKLLIQPIRHLLGGKHLVIAPHGTLHKLPFHALFDGDKYLVDDFAISYAPSASVYAICQTRGIPNGRRALVMGIPDSSVPYVEEEVKRVASYLPECELLLGKSASVDRLRQSGGSCRIIHIATHGYFRHDNPIFSSVLLGDSYLSLYDLYQLKLSAELVTLSGCSTGLSVVAEGDELLGLARGLLHAGAASSIVSLWDVHDRSSADLMELFYSNLGLGLGKAESMRNAMLALKLEQPHPYYWAPFVLMGQS